MIYKYLDEETLQPVQDRTLKFATLEDLNDPFESLPVIKSRAMKPEDVPLVLEGMGLLEGYSGDWDPTVLEELARKYNEAWEESRDETKHRFSSILTQISVREQVDTAVGWGVLSLSENPKSSLMWSHYCNKHKGYVLGFDEEHGFFQRGKDKSSWLGKLRPVCYRDNRAEIGSETGDGDSFGYKFRKSTSWSYEDEVRMFMPLSSCTRINPSLHVLTFPDNALREVIFGFRCPEDIVNKIQQLLDGVNVDYLRAVPSSVTFDMELMPERDFFSDQDSYLKAARDNLKPTIDRLIQELA